VGILRRKSRRLAVFLLIAGSLSIPVSKADEKVQWQGVDQLCGQLQLEAPRKKIIIVDGKTEPRLYTAYLPDATATLYPATYCRKGMLFRQPHSDRRSRKYGAFELRAFQPGYYCESGKLLLKRADFPLDEMLTDPWPGGDDIAHDLQCTRCGRGFELYVNV
jgi:hypothetical protein